MICSVELKLKLIKMNRQKLITSKEYWIEQLENRAYNGVSIYKFAETIANTMKEAMNYNQCCTQLKDKKAMSFSEWKIINFDYNNGLYNDLVDKRKFYTQAQILKKYNKEILNL